VAAGPWDPAAVSRGRMRASDADRDRAVDALKHAYVQGLLTTEELAARTGQALAARTYADLTAATAVPAVRCPPRPAAGPRPRRRVARKVVAGSACVIGLTPALIAAFLTFYGGFIILFLVTCVGAVISAGPMPPRRPGILPSAGRR
jgi:uncharacterized protein DUF1707